MCAIRGVTHTRLLEFCHDTRLSYHNRNVPPDVMRNPTKWAADGRPGHVDGGDATRRPRPSGTYATTGLKMSATGTNALCSSHTTRQGLGSLHSARQASRPSIIPLHTASDGSPRSMHPRSGSALDRNSTILTLGQHPILLHSATRTACLFRSSTASRASRILLPMPQLQMMSTRTFGPQLPFLFRP